MEGERADLRAGVADGDLTGGLAWDLTEGLTGDLALGAGLEAEGGDFLAGADFLVAAGLGADFLAAGVRDAWGRFS
ncbi:MAG: hypothetical protein HC901_03560 [Bdellovibrionaceae bacterium]|nr:hypothetical protein [Pseudobdellovibrionaceae bacterium]